MGQAHNGGSVLIIKTTNKVFKDNVLFLVNSPFSIPPEKPVITQISREHFTLALLVGTRS